MPKLKVLSGKDVVKIVSRILLWNKANLNCSSSRRVRQGSLKNIYRQALRYIPEEKLKTYFYDLHVTPFLS